MTKVSLDLIQKLRDISGVGMMDCKKALIEADGDMDKAIELLRKKGAAVAEKRSGNATAEGLVHAYIHPGAQIGVMLEINCETDFVARTADIKQFAQDICMHIAALKPLYVSAAQVDAVYLEKERKFFKEQLLEQGKPEKMVDQIVDGKIQKLYADICLVDQKFVKNDQITVGDLLKDLIAKMGESIKITRFARFEIGA
ncbi:MAG: translation elongation factor Ts [Candidatus Babeliaceae bacterium]|nr:translation elongation factor Ts [Candidatus Babeliaceae bacterium]